MNVNATMNNVMLKDINPLKEAAGLGEVDAQILLGLAYQTGNLFVVKDMHKSLSWYKAAAEKSSVIAQYLVADFYARGVAVEQSPETAFYYISLAAKAGFTPAKFQMVEYLERGFGVAQDYSAGRDILAELAESGNSCAALYLGLRYSAGGYYEVDKNLEKASQWWEHASNLGNVSAHFFLATYYDEKKEYQKSIFLYEKAANGGHEGACHILAIRYSKGTHGVPRDLSKADEYLVKAKQCEDEVIKFARHLKAKQSKGPKSVSP